jgi:hypothetical protein
VAPINFVEMVAPSFFGDGRTAPIWAHGYMYESHGFVGIAGLALAAVGVAAGRHRQRYLWAGVALVGAALALGRYSPAFRIFFSVVPGAGLFRGPGRYLLLTVVGLTALAGMGLDALLAEDGSRKRQIRGVAIAIGALALLAAGFRISLPSGEGPGPAWWTSLVESERTAYRAEKGGDAPPASVPMSAKSLLWASLCGTAAALALAFRRGISGPAALGLLLVGELGVYASRCYTGTPTEDMVLPPEFTSHVRSHAGFPFRIATVTMSQAPEIGKCQLAGLDHVGGYDPLMLHRYTELVNVGRGKPASDLVTVMAYPKPGPVFDLLGARYWIVPGARQEPPGWRTVGQLASGFVYENPRALPRAFLVGRSVRIESAEERLRYLAQPAFEPSRVVVLENGTSGAEEGEDAAPGSVRIEAMGPGQYDLRAESSRDAWLVLTEAWYPGWTVEIDGRAAELHHADHLFQAVRVPSGRHEVRFRYQPRFLASGFWIAAIAALIPVVFLFLRRMRGSA